MATIEAKQKTNNLPWLIILGALAILGIAAWIVQLTQGFKMIGVGQVVVWGIYIAAFFLLLGTGCGLVLFAVAGDLNFLPGMQAHRRLLLISALGMFIAGGITILMDIGRPARVLNLLFSSQFNSPFIWDFYGLAVMVVLTVVYLIVNPKGKLLPWVIGIVSLLVIVIEGWILGVLAARPLWHGGLMPILFLLEALTAASAFLFLALGKNLPWVKKVFMWLLVILGLVTLIDTVAVLYSGPTAAQEGMNLLVSGNLAPYF
jgi:dimethyl sulfoxide reductase membrane subunit